MTNNNIGRIHSIESFSTVDGPGIRFVVFMQGCPMRCIYCQNPDTLNYEDGKEIDQEELFLQIKSALSFLKKNDGGLTVSGGEPLAQPEFIGALFKRVKKTLGISTAVDTSGCVPLSKPVRNALTYCDYVLIDVKHTNPVKHVMLTGRGLGLIRDFFSYIQTIPHLKIWVRHVIVPNYTTSEQDLDGIAKFISSLKQVERVELLPYHNLGEYKWEQLPNREYKLKNEMLPTREEVEKILVLMKDYGINATSVYEE